MKDKCDPSVLTENDILEAMQSIQGYVDITPRMFREIYTVSYDLALKRLQTQWRAKDVMTTPVHCVNQTMLLIEASALMSENEFSGAPVVDDKGVICGVLSEKDFLREMGLPINSGIISVIGECLNVDKCLVSGMRRIKVRKVMSSPPIVTHEESTLAEISQLFINHSINRIPICSEDKTLLGIVTRSDLVNCMCQMV